MHSRHQYDVISTNGAIGIVRLDEKSPKSK